MDTVIDQHIQSPSASRSQNPAPPPETVLFVDDDPLILEGFQRQFRKKYRLQTALGPECGLEAVQLNGPFAVVVSDLQMPGMDGVQFLAAVRAKSPETVRVMLTGQAHLSTTIAAVNQGSIFRFLVKPCASTVLDKVIEAGIQQHRLIVAEKQLTQETLLGCVQVLVEVLSIVQPKAFSRAARLGRYVRQLAVAMAIEGAWQFEAAALLSQIGWITLAPEIAEKALRPHTLSPEERQRFLPHAAVAARLLEKVARLEVVARIIGAQHTPYSELVASPDSDPGETGIVGAAMLQAVIDFDNLRQEDFSHGRALEHMRAQPGLYSPNVLAAMVSLQETGSAYEVRAVRLLDFAAKMILDEDIVGKHGVCLLAKGQEITPTTLQHLRNFSSAPFTQTYRVRVRTTDSS